MDERLDEREREQRKRAIFEAMSERGKKRVLRIGYENWDPFQEPKDPRKLIRSSSAIRASTILHEFYDAYAHDQRLRSYHKDLLEFCIALIRGDRRAKALLNFCNWYCSNEENPDSGKTS